MSKKFTAYLMIALVSLSTTGCSIENPFAKKETATKKETTKKPEVPQQNEKTFKATCKTYDYNELARYPEKYQGQPILLEGIVLQVTDEGKKELLSLDTTGNGDIVYVTYIRQDENVARILEDDRIKLWGIFQGVTNTETVLGSQSTLPSVEAAYVEVIAEKVTQEEAQETLAQEQPIQETEKKEVPTVTSTPTSTQQLSKPNNYYVISDSSSRYLSGSDLSSLSDYQLKIARNEIYARHGYIFETSEMKNYFNNQAWYNPSISASNFSDSMLNSIETHNIDLIKQFENGTYGANVKGDDYYEYHSYVIPDSSSRYLTASDVQGLSSYQLKIARNEIYARHGYIFQTDEMRNYFNNQAWYTPSISASNFSDSLLNDIEQHNINLIKQYE